MAVQRNLPLTTQYKFVSSFYSPVLEGGGWCCENCNKLISTIVTIENESGKQFLVGSDCAKTLQGINKTDLDNIEVSTKKAKKFLKALDQNKTLLIGIDPENNDTLLLFSITTESYGKPLDRPFIHVPFISMPKSCLPKRLEEKVTTKDSVLGKYPSLVDNYYIIRNYIK